MDVAGRCVVDMVDVAWVTVQHNCNDMEEQNGKTKVRREGTPQHVIFHGRPAIAAATGSSLDHHWAGHGVSQLATAGPGCAPFLRLCTATPQLFCKMITYMWTES